MGGCMQLHVLTLASVNFYQMPHFHMCGAAPQFASAVLRCFCFFSKHAMWVGKMLQPRAQGSIKVI